MSLDLDTRQRAMLQEMGVHVWLPEPPPRMSAPTPAATLAPVQHLSADAIEKVATQALQTAPAAPKAIKSLPVSNLANVNANTPPATAGLTDGIANMDWPTLSDTLRQCEACKLCNGRRAPVFEAANAALDTAWHADWLVVGDPPDEHDEREGTPMSEQAGQLLDNMLKAVGVARHGKAAASVPAHTAYVTQVVKCRTDPARNPSAAELATCEHFLRREVALVKPKVIVAMGRFAAQTLLQGSLPEGSKAPFGKLRGTVYRYQGIPVIVTYHPAYLLRTPLDKARAWVDLCLAMETINAG